MDSTFATMHKHRISAIAGLSVVIPVNCMLFLPEIERMVRNEIDEIWAERQTSARKGSSKNPCATVPVVEEDLHDGKCCDAVVGAVDMVGGYDQNGSGGEVPGRNGHRFDGADRNERGGEEVSATGVDPSAVEENNAVPRCFRVDAVALVVGDSCSVENSSVLVDRFRDNGGSRGIRNALDACCCYNLFVGGGESDAVTAADPLPREKTRTSEQEEHVLCGRSRLCRYPI